HCDSYHVCFRLLRARGGCNQRQWGQVHCSSFHGREYFRQPDRCGDLVGRRLGNTYSVATTQYDGVNNQSLAICYAANVKSGANTVTAAFSGSPLYRRLLIHEYRGIASANPVDVVAKNIANGTTSANAITSTSAVTTASGDLIFGVVMDDSGVLSSITAGTGLTQRQSVNNKDMATEDLRQVVSGPVAATQT